MAKMIADSVLDAALAKIATSTHVNVTSSLPANYAAIAGVSLAAKTIVAGDGNGDWTIAAGAQRKVTETQESAISITSSGTATNVVNDDGTTLLGGTTCTSQALTSGGTVTIPAFKYEFAAPT